MTRKQRYQLLILVLAALGIYQTVKAASWLQPPYVYSKDIIQEYLLAKAVIAGVNPYQPLPDLAATLMNQMPFPIIPHPSAHPPAVTVLFLPFALAEYRTAAAIWFVFELMFTFGAIRLLLRSTGRRTTILRSLIIMFAALTWKPFFIELEEGQLMTLLLLLFAFSWSALRSGQEMIGGAALGCAMAIKIAGWPIIIFLLLRRQWRAVISASVTTATVNLIAVPFIGWHVAVNYYLRIGPAVSSLISDLYRNFSPYSIGFRIFKGTSVSGLPSEVTAPALVYAPHLAIPVSLLAAAALLLYGLRASLRARSFDAAFGVLVCVSTVINPVAWDHYLLLILVTIPYVISRLLATGLPRKETVIAGIIGVLLYSYYHLELALRIFYGARNTLDAPTIRMPFYASLVTLTPLLAVIGLISLLSQIDGARRPSGLADA